MAQTTSSKGHAPVGNKFLTARLDDVSTASSVFIPIPEDGDVIDIMYVPEAAPSAGAASITCSLHRGGATAQPIGGLTASIGSAAVVGQGLRFEADDGIDVLEFDSIQIETDGGSTGTAPLSLVLQIGL